MNVHALDAVMLDLDGTLVDTLGDFEAAASLMLEDIGLARVGRDVVARLIGSGANALVREVLVAAGARPEGPLLELAAGCYRARYVQVNGCNATVYPGVFEGLQQLAAAGLKLACVTNKLSLFALPLLRDKGLDGYFSQVLCGEGFTHLKPDPQPLLATCEALGTAPGRTLMLGDSRNDARAARAAGCPVVLVTYGYNHGEPVRGIDADGFIDSIAELAR